jgi:hypothetical protein
LKFQCERSREFGLRVELLSLPDWKGGQEGLKFSLLRKSLAARRDLFGRCQPVGDIGLCSNVDCGHVYGVGVGPWATLKKDSTTLDSSRLVERSIVGGSD